MQEALRRLGHTALCAVSGEEALALMRSNRFDAVLSDLSMPDMSGWAVAEHLIDICNRQNIPKTPFILLTGSATEIEDDQRLEQCGVDALLEKPVELKKLVQVVMKAACGIP
jgi:two-component system capsular synthesis sensor histidine kinase RcsC